MDRADLDAWVVAAREYNEDPVLQTMLPATWLDTAAWTRKSILNSARSGKFSSDRSIADYCDDVWNVGPVPVND